MAIINKTGITNGGTIQASHVTRAIDALSGGSTDTVIASGSFSGSLVGGPVNVSTVTATSTIQSSGAIIGSNLTIDTGNSYVISVTADSMSFNSANEDFNTEIKHYGGAASTIFSANGISTNNRIVATSFTGSLQGTASFAVSSSRAISSSFATTASFALNAGGGSGGGIFALTGSTYATTNNLQITGSLLVTAGVTASLQGTASFAVSSSRAVTASFADLSRQVLVQRTAADADHFMVIVDSGNATPAAESLNTVTNMRVNPGTDTISAVNVSGSFTVTGSMSAIKFATVDLRILGDATSSGQFAIPIQQTGGSPFAGSMYWNDATEVLYIYSATNNRWTNVQLNP